MQSERNTWLQRGCQRVGMLAMASVLLVGAWRVSVGAEGAHAQQAQRPPAEATTTEPPVPTNTDNPMKEQMQVAAVGERHKRLVADSDRLLQLATELKAEVDKSTKNEMSVTAIKKAAEIEKLAHDVKDRMKGE